MTKKTKRSVRSGVWPANARARASVATTPVPLSLAPGPPASESPWAQKSRCPGAAKAPPKSKDAGKGRSEKTPSELFDELGDLGVPVVAAGVVYAMDANAQVSALRAEDGRLLWRVSLAPENEVARAGLAKAREARPAVEVAPEGDHEEPQQNVRYEECFDHSGLRTNGDA